MNKKKKILFTIPNFDTAGSGKVVYDLVRYLDKDKFEPEICCFHDKGDFFKVIETLGIKIHLFQFTTPYKPYLTFFQRVNRIAKFFRSNKYDLIHSWHWSSDFSEPLAAKIAGIPFVYTKKAMGWGNKAWTWRSKLSTEIIVINTDMISEFFSKMSSKVHYIPLGVDTHYFKPQEKVFNTPDNISFTAKDFVISTIVNLVPVKGIELLIEAVKLLSDNDIKLLVIGNDQSDYAKELKLKYRDLSSVHFLGKQLDVRPYLAVADVFVIPTKNEGRREGLPVAPLEAMASGRLVLGSRIAGIKDVLKDFPDCLFEPNSVEAIASKIKTIKALDVSEKNRIEKEMRHKVEHVFSIEECIAKHEDFYHNIIT
ncbi:glycosyltransferase family 4 protein [uncultured Psychroserpens sp.]|uniref:glycosyltransferase family 4 protein n=1 Tax=uncultured Psychroserpens sp. TaxID=255436 RepID=UPI002621C7F7|nr:glycosyltransferase family 4 protein [uncultured Psychroserpens sp.]